MAATLKNIKASFEAAGAVYEVSGTMIPIIHFSQEFASKIGKNATNKAYKKLTRAQREGINEKRVSINEINICTLMSTSEKVQAISEKKFPK